MFSEKVVEAAVRSGYAVAPHLVPSRSQELDAADWRWLGLCSELTGLAREANAALESAGMDARIAVDADTERRELSLYYGDRWLRVERERVFGRGHIIVERSYRLPAFPPEPVDRAALEDLVFELISAAPAAPQMV